MRSIRAAIITGPTGAIGQALCRYLLAREVEVYAICRSNSLRAKMLPKHIFMHKILCDISNLELLPEMLSGVSIDAFFHLAWAGNDGDNRNNMELQISNIRYALKACHVAKIIGCQIFIGAGSQAEYGRVDFPLTPDTPCFPENGYGMAKFCVRQMTRMECQKLEIKHVWAVFLSIYGPYEQMTSLTITTISKLLKGESPDVTAGEQIWDYLYSSDAAEALYRIAVYGVDGSVYTIGGGKALPLRNYIEIIRDIINPSLTVNFGAKPYAEHQVMHLEADISMLTADTGFVPSTDFYEGIHQTVKWVKGTIL